MSPALGPGVVLGERYVLQRETWRSPVGPVWQATDSVLDRPVYVQTLDRRAGAESRRNFRRAAARAAQYAHPSLLRIYDIGEVPHFIVFEMAPGGRLEDRLRAGPLDPQEASRIALALARGLEALHEQSSWHGVLSPATVFLDAEGRPKIAAGMPEMLSVAGRGRPKGYSAPEPDPSPAAADRFALAALTYHMLTGRSPARPPASPRSVRRGLPHTLDRLLVRMLSQDPTERPSLDAFEGALAPYARPKPPDVREPRFVRSSEFRWLLPAVLIVALAAAAVYFGLRIDFTEREPARSTPSPTLAGESVEVAEVTDFDPEGNGEESPKLATNATDGNPLTAWRTVGYRSADLGGKSGVGLIFDLGESREVSTVLVRSTLPGWAAELRAAGEGGSRAADFRTLTNFTASEETTVRLPRTESARYFLLWITRLIDDESGNEFPFRAFVAEVEFFPP